MSISISLNLKERKVYIIGGGAVALRKAKQFQREGAIVFVVAPTFLDEFYHLSNIHLLKQECSWDVIASDAFLLYAATNDEYLNHTLMEGAKQRDILCGSATYDEACDFHSMTQLQDSYFQLAISTNGTCPGANKAFLSMLEQLFQSMKEISHQLARIRACMPTIQKEVISSLALVSIKNLKRIADAYEYKQTILILVYHGIANVKAMEKGMREMEEKIQAVHPQYQILHVFESNKIAQKAKQKGYCVDTYEHIVECITSLQLSFLVQPMLLQKGTWYETLNTQGRKVGECLLENKDDVKQLYQIIKQENNHQPIIGVYHDVEQDLFAQFIPEESDLFLSLSKLEPNVLEPRILVPLFIFVGHHASQAIQMHTDQKIAYDNKGLLENPQIQAMFLEKINKFVSKSTK